MTEETLFEQALAIDSATERQRFVDDAFAGKPDDRDRFLVLLAAHGSEDDLLDVPNALGETEVVAACELPDQLGRQIGPYKLLQQIGQGGFGVVYLAEECKTINRRVALKIIKPGMGSKEVIARFEAERQALAMMEHDNIARVFGGGTTDDGLPYFVMELVKGVPITEYCVHKGLSAEERLELFTAVCRGVHHAHQKGIIHRDLKPSNILVAEYDHRPVVKIIDFGVAKALNQRLTEQTLFTNYGSVIGTIQYMSPEQAKFNQLDVDTRSDVYSLGAVLYELLTGSTPISKERVQSASFEEVIRWIREEEPSKPSTKVSSAVGEASEDLVQERVRLSRLIRGDLDWIVMKALEKVRDRRYASASEFADDIDRFLRQEPVSASPPSVVYKLRKFVRRHRAGVTTACVIAAMILVIAGISLLWHIDRLEAKTLVAERRAAELELIESRRQQKLKAEKDKLEQTTLPAIESASAKGKYQEAFDLLQEAKGRFPEDQRLKQLVVDIACRWSIRSEPAGAQVTLWKYADPAGSEPVATVVTPAVIDVAKGYYRFRMEKSGYETVEGLAGPDAVSLTRKMDEAGSIPAEMVRVPASMSAGIQHDFLIDRYEVTNGEFRKFVQNGGYQKEYIWQHVVGLGNNWKSPVSKFVDQTGKPGPAHWREGTYLPGTAKEPVVGICWAEATAYAASKGKLLPSIHHWNHASGQDLATAILPASNLVSEKLRAVGESRSLGPYGTVDMFGNASEWCANAFGDSAKTVGGNSFTEPAYDLRAGKPWDANARDGFVGFRCMKSVSSKENNLFAAIGGGPEERFDGREPVRDAEFQKLCSVYHYDKDLPLEAELESGEKDFFPGVTRERYSINTAYGGRMLVYLYRSNATTQDSDQVFVFLSGAGGFQQDYFARNYATHIRTLVGLGRSVVVPIVFGMYERRAEAGGVDSGVAAVTRQVKDVLRCVDFLSETEAYAQKTLVYIGSSYGGRLGPVVCALEPRFRAAVYLNGGVRARAKDPRIDSVHFAPRARQPSLMLNGINDHVFPVESCQKPMFRLLGSPDDQKQHLLVGVGHSIPMGPFEMEVKRFLSTNFGGAGRSAVVPDDYASYYRDRADLALANRQVENADSLLEQHIKALEASGDESDLPEVLESQVLRTILSEWQNGLSSQTVTRARESFETAQKIGGHPNALLAKHSLAYVLTRRSVRGLLEHELDSPRFAASKSHLQELHELVPGSAWPHLASAVLAYREGDLVRSEKHLRQCENRPFTWNLEFVIRSLIAIEKGNVQESQDWLTAMSLERSKRFQDSLLPRSDEWMSKANNAIAESADSDLEKDPDGAIQRLIDRYPSHYYLHWLSGLQAARKKNIESAHSHFQQAYAICPGYRSTDWLAITAQWLGEEATLQACRDRLVDIARLKTGTYLWDGLHVVRAHCRTAVHEPLSPEETEWFERLVERLRKFHPSQAPETAALWLGNKQGENNVIPAFTHSGSPEEQAESMALNAMTEYQFGDRSIAYRELDDSRQFIETTLAQPDGPPFKHIDAAHAYYVSRLLLREAAKMIELDSEEFDSHVAESVGRIRSELQAEVGEHNVRRILHRVGETLAEKYADAEGLDVQ